MTNDVIIGIDLGATNVRGGVVQEYEVSEMVSARIHNEGSVEDVLNDLFHITDKLINPSVKAIGVGVPSVVDIEEGIVYDVQYIPSWKEVPLKKIMEDRYHVPVLVNNDSNCFALGEYYFGKGKAHASMIGITLGTGLGAGVIINNKLYAGRNCGAGEFGMVDYLSHCYEYYAAGQFFENVYKADGEAIFQKAQNGDKEALQMYRELGTHLGNAVKLVLYTYDPEMIVFGGSVRHAYPFFSETMWRRISTFAYKRSLLHFKIELSDLPNSGILGAAALYHNYNL